jgi:ribonuclease T2
MRTSSLRLRAMACLLMLALLIFASPASAQQKGEPGKFDFYLMNLAWGPEFCSVPGVGSACKAPRGFVLHGLWPQNYDGSYPVNCGEQSGPAQSEQYLDITPDLSLLKHEWRKHGTCTTMSPDEFFGLERQAFHSVRIPKKLRKLKHEEPMRPKDILDLFAKANPSFPQDSVVVSCEKERLTAVEVCLAKDGLMPISCHGLRQCDAQALKVMPSRGRLTELAPALPPQ